MRAKVRCIKILSKYYFFANFDRNISKKHGFFFFSGRYLFPKFDIHSDEGDNIKIRAITLDIAPKMGAI